ncbi:MAG: hypothetical protein NTX22_02775 [Ignavibacteriales bacterium]|nr:hypothetical protein [Ignavibacteriales bacterium]
MSKRIHTIYISFFFLVTIVVTIYLTITGFNYFTTPVTERFWNPDYSSLKPSGIIGHGTGIIGSLLMIAGVAIYMLRKRVRRFFHIGILKYWLEFHIFLCTLGPILVLFHTSFKFGGIVSVSFWSMVAVVLSGIIGRFIYIQIPRSIQGQELGIKELDEINFNLNFRLRNELKIEESILLEIEEAASIKRFKNLTLLKSIYLIFIDYYKTKLLVRKFKKEIKTKQPNANVSEIVKAAKSKLILSRRIGLLRSMQSLFKYWHVAHLPFAMVMFLIMIIHIIITITFGYKWIF